MNSTNDLYVKASLADYDRTVARMHLVAEARRNTAHTATRRTPLAKARYVLATLARMARRPGAASVATIQSRRHA